MLAVVVKYFCKPGKREEFIERSMAAGVPAGSQVDKGNICYDLARAVEDPDILYLFEKWESEADQIAHLDTPHIKALKPIKESCVENTVIEKYVTD